MAPQSPSSFRADIEGLRCIAVLAVLLFHLEPKWLPGGFQGVDIFFVISGYLITGLIRGRGEEFSFYSFYRRRFWRLYPALAATVGATLIAGYVVLSPPDYAALAASGLSALFGVSNFFFFGHLDYFNDNTVIHPLLHTWSLGVEEQFYLFWPLLIVVGARRMPFAVLLAGLFAAALALSLFGTGANPQFAFYMMPFRIFEFAAGAAVLLASKRLAPNGPGAMGGGALGALGLLLVAAGLLWFGENTAWPGAAALLPTLGTALLIHAGPARPWRTLLGNPVFRFIGRISYALYLVHWPLITLYRYWRVIPLTLAELAGLALLSIAGAFLLHIAIETPFREGEPSTGGLARFVELRRFAVWRRVKAPLAALGTVVAAALAIGIWAADGLPGRVAKQRAQQSSSQLSYAGDICAETKSRRCVLGDATSDRLVYVVGDSHAGNLFSGLDALFREQGIRGIAIIDHGCLFLFNTTRFIKGRYDKGCARNIAGAYAAMASDRAPVILAGSAEEYVGVIGPADASAPGDLSGEAYYRFVQARLIEGLEHLRANERPVLLVKSAYNSGVDIARCLLRPGVDRMAALAGECRPNTLAQSRRISAQADAAAEAAAARFARATTLDPKPAFCGEAGCTILRDGIFLMRDTTHLTNEGSAHLIGHFRADLLAWLGN